MRRARSRRMPKLVEICCNKKRGIAAWDDGTILTVRASGDWSVQRNCREEPVLCLLDGTRGEIVSSGNPDTSSIYLTPEQQDCRAALLSDIASLRASK